MKNKRAYNEIAVSPCFFLVARGGIEPPTQGFSSFFKLQEFQRLEVKIFYKNEGTESRRAFAGATRL
jgi:hypothetical protein